MGVAILSTPRGILTGQVKSAEFGPKDFRRMSPRFQGENFQKNVDLASRVHDFARARGCTPGPHWTT